MRECEKHVALYFVEMAIRDKFEGQEKFSEES
jgi:hypothetical protein